MPKHSHPDPGYDPDKNQVDASSGYERTDANVAGIIVFLTALAIFAAVTGFLCYGIGKLINAHLNKEDGPDTKWTKSANLRELGNMPSSPELQNKVAELTQQFPTPRLQTDDGNQDVADLHAREDLLLDNYTWIDATHTKVRIPIERAMELIAQRGLPVAPAAELPPPMMGDVRPQVQMPLTNGFARTAFEQEQVQQEAAEIRQHQEQNQQEEQK